MRLGGAVRLLAITAITGGALVAPQAPLAAAGQAPVGAAAARPAATRRQAPRLEVDYQRSTVVAKTSKAGLLRFLGHEHGILPGDWSAQVRFDPEDLGGSSIVVEIDAAGLIIDSEAARRLAGVDPDGPSVEETRQISADMHSGAYLDSAGFPVVRFESSALSLPSADTLRIDGTLTLHGVARQVSADAELTRQDGGYVVRGSFAIEQRDFGIEPASIGGVVKVANEVEVRFEIFAAPAAPSPVAR